MRFLYTTFVTSGMFLVRMLLLGLMALLQLSLGGAEISRRPSPASASA